MGFVLLIKRSKQADMWRQCKGLSVFFWSDPELVHDFFDFGDYRNREVGIAGFGIDE